MAIQNRYRLYVQLHASVSFFAANCPWCEREAVHMPCYPRHMLPLISKLVFSKRCGCYFSALNV